MSITHFVRRLCRLGALHALAAACALGSSAPALAQSDGGGVSLAGVGHDLGTGSKPRVFIVEFADFGCGYCAKFAQETFHQIDSAYVRSGVVTFKYVPFVTGNFRNSREVAEAAECAGEQNGYWKMHDLLFQRRKEWMSTKDIKAVIVRYAQELKLDTKRLSFCQMSTGAHRSVTHNDLLANTLGIRATPTFFVNGRMIQGAIPFDVFRQVIEGSR
jgi:protein-disulfide isomerase